MIQGGLDVCFCKVGILFDYLCCAATSLVKSLDCSNRNPSAGNHGGILCCLTMALNVTYFFLWPLSKALYISFRIGNHNFEHNRNRILPAYNFSWHLRFRIDKNNLFLQNIQGRLCPFVVRQMTELFGDLPKVLKRYAELVAQNSQDPQGNQILERINSAERFPPIFGGKTWHKEARAIPMSQLMSCKPREARNVLFAECLDDV